MHEEVILMSKKCTSCNKIFEDDSLLVCPDCNTDLVDNIDEEKEVSVFSLTNEESAQGVIEYMKEQGIKSTYRYNLREKNFKIYVMQSDARAALRACTSFYAIEAKRLKAEEDKKREAEEAARRAEEEARLKAEEEERLRREEEERIRREEEEARLRAEEEARLKAEEEERLRREEQEALLRAAEEERLRIEEEARKAMEEAERARIEAEEAAKRAEEAIRQAEEEARLKAEEEERLRREEEERLRREEEERKLAEEQKRIAEEQELKRLASEKRRKMFEEGIRVAEQQRKSEQTGPSIPHVKGETVHEEPVNIEEHEIIPESGPIFVETEPVDEYAVGDTIVVDAVDVSDDDFYNMEDGQSLEDNDSDNTDEDSFNDFLSGFKKKSFSPSSFAAVEDENEYSSPVVEEMFTNNMFAASEAELSSAEKDADDNGNSPTFESIINNRANKTEPKIEGIGRNKFADKFRQLANVDDVDDGTYKGFVPDYHQDDPSKDPDVETANAYGFDPEAFKALKEETAKKVQSRKNNPIERPRRQSKDFQLIEDDIPDDGYKGFVPDYSSKKDEEKMSYYTRRTSIDYSKYRTSTDSVDRNSISGLAATLRYSSQTELNNLFEPTLIKNAAKPSDYTDLKSSTYILALTGGQLNSLINAWLMANCNSVSVKQYEKPDATPEQNYQNKINGIKALLKSNLGKLDESAIDIIVTKFYNKYLDD